jgi:hypothetical protein
MAVPLRNENAGLLVTDLAKVCEPSGASPFQMDEKNDEMVMADLHIQLQSLPRVFRGSIDGTRLAPQRPHGFGIRLLSYRILLIHTQCIPGLCPENGP